VHRHQHRHGATPSSTLSRTPSSCRLSLRLAHHTSRRPTAVVTAAWSLPTFCRVQHMPRPRAVVCMQWSNSDWKKSREKVCRVRTGAAIGWCGAAHLTGSAHRARSIAEQDGTAAPKAPLLRSPGTGHKRRAGGRTRQRQRLTVEAGQHNNNIKCRCRTTKVRTINKEF
jgi:hypothetical protein